MDVSLLLNSTKYDISYMIGENFTQSYLTVSETNAFDTAMYVCEAYNVVGNDSHSSSLQVKGEMMPLVLCCIISDLKCPLNTTL